MTTQPPKLKINVYVGAIKKIIVFVFVGKINSFDKSLIASAIGCNKPYKPTKVGPTRLCKLAITCLSAKEIYATEPKITIIMINILIIKKINIYIYI
jgi:hypothetical protein